ncbi:hypothetical protein DICPUDRAFT_92712 [Dictyostelium purpureum]|uniref:Isopentenyl transferase n=1 Tax=Dictyostelium purpureum TaxID=5786 RepID=F0ZW40_DICPU|nr:uncharacterized protein DICPUDRAFT_92712 [Dictyostelium purpureum]EGC31839.1 hypothetical protein DICPUDRAFT_92712 [Dictyostelium purpureum]|eukprot:XP_003291640.1 hypothetical protein DICPUDRAFT_92712 [Dictyostelium purpureum]
MKVLLIIGPTGIGKTNLSIEYSKRNDNCPVIVLDRIQCYSEMSILSGRPSDLEFKGINRIYLSNLYLKDGKDINKDFLMKRLIEILNDIKQSIKKSIYNSSSQISNSKSFDCIIEGGSITLINELFLNQEKYLTKIDISSIIYLRPEDSVDNQKKYYLKIKKRVKEMCFPTDSSSDSMIKEVQRILKSNSNCPSIKDILNFLVKDVAINKVINYIEYVNRNGTQNDIKLNSINNTLIKNITMGHYNYAYSQVKVFDSLVKNLPSNIYLSTKNILI